MPTYDYQCDNCAHEFEIFQSMTAKVLKKCPQCGQLSLRRMIGTGAAVLFKGSGFYATDYRSESYEKGAKAEKEKKDKGKESKAKKDESKEKKKDSSTASVKKKDGD